MNYEYWADLTLIVLATITVNWFLLGSTGWGDYPLGNDGLTDNERADYAWSYEQGPGRKWLTDEEKKVIAAWQASKERLKHG